jgi:hypothetical protein
MAKAIAEGYHSITPYLVVNDAAAASIIINAYLMLKNPTDILAQMEKALSMQS